MKRTWILVSLIFLGLGVSAQVSSDAAIRKTYQMENVSSDDLNLKAYQWFSNFFKSGQNELLSIQAGDNLLQGKTKLVFGNEEVIFDFESVVKGSDLELSFSNLSNSKEVVVQFLNSIQERFGVILDGELTEDVKAMLQDELAKLKTE